LKAAYATIMRVRQQLPALKERLERIIEDTYPLEMEDSSFFCQRESTSYSIT